MLESADLPVAERKAFYERALSELRTPEERNGSQTERQLREESARLRAELSSRR